jgi:glycosyltransferase involved in cell wall biosynthesis
LVSRWQPDLIFASAPPNSALVAASRIARACGVPWVAELRDLWVGNPYYEHPRWRMMIDRFLERRTLRNAAGLVSVTPPDTESLRRSYKQPASCTLNGFDPADFPKESPRPGPGDVVSLVYTGNIYAGFRDPTPLFKAINLLSPEERNKVAVHFYGPPAAQVHEFASAQNVVDRVFVHDRVTYRESLAIQCAADVLLLLQWADKRDAGNIPAKFFEYLGAGRPILMMGYEQGTLAQMIRQRHAGLVSNTPALIAEQLRKWIAQRPQGIPGLPASASADMTRDEQFRKLERFILDIVSGHQRETGAMHSAAQTA